jgi:uncharacterized protein (DUF305 family)
VRISPRPVLLALTAGTVLFAACSTGSDATSSDTLPPVAPVGDAELTTGFNDADVLFAQGLIPHHRDAVAMAEMALAPEAQSGAEVQALATQIQGVQDPEIEQMTSLLESWGQPVEMPGMDESGDMESMDVATGMMSAENMAALAALTGPEFDTAWASAMIVHHEGAVSMAQTVKRAGSNPEVLALAEAIIVSQEADIDQMKAFTGS